MSARVCLAARCLRGISKNVKAYHEPQLVRDVTDTRVFLSGRSISSSPWWLSRAGGTGPGLLGAGGPGQSPWAAQGLV